ncbi:MAG TPA: ATPase [Allosphingosinicella sp.]|nr:ATPase [Allosphingosinicella sp.]
MPQLAQFHEIFWSQLFWLALVFALIFFVIGRGMLPRIQSTVDLRDSRIAEDLAAAESARGEVDEAEKAYRLRMDSDRAEAFAMVQAAKQDMAREAEERIRAADSEIGAKIEAEEARVRAATDAALSDIESVAAEAAEEMVAKLAGLSVDRKRAVQAVRTAMANG